MGFGCILLHLTSHFAAFNLAFCCILPCILVHIAMRFDCKMHCIILFFPFETELEASQYFISPNILPFTTFALPLQRISK